MRTKISVLLCAALFLTATGVFVLWLFAKPAEDNIVGFVPAESIAYVHLYLKPSTKQRMAIRDLLERLPLDADARSLKEALGRLLDPVLAVSGMNFKDDVSPWLGNQMGFFSLPGGQGEAVLLEIAEGLQDQAGHAAGKVTSDRLQIAAKIVEDVLIIGVPVAVTAAAGVGSAGSSLASSETYERAVELLPDDRTLTVYAAASEDQDSVASAGGVARPDGVALDLVVPGAETQEIGPGELSEMIGRLDRANVLPFDRFGDLLARIEEGGPLVVTALRVSGVLKGGGPEFDALLGEGFDSSLVLDAARVGELSGVLPIGDDDSGLVESARYISHIVLGTHPDGTIRIFIGVK